MKKKIIGMLVLLLLVMPVLSFAEKQENPSTNLSAREYANKNAKFKRSGDWFYSKANKERRVKRLAKKKAAQAKKKAAQAQEKGEGQVEVKF